MYWEIFGFIAVKDFDYMSIWILCSLHIGFINVGDMKNMSGMILINIPFKYFHYSKAYPFFYYSVFLNHYGLFYFDIYRVPSQKSTHSLNDSKYSVF